MPLKFTNSTIQSLKCPEGKKDKLFFDTEVKGLVLRVTTQDSKIFVARWTDPVTRQKRIIRLGEWGSITLDAARDAARIRLGDVAKGNNPIADMKAAALEEKAKKKEEKLTLELLIDEWEESLDQHRDSYRREATRALRVNFAEFLNGSASKLSKSEARKTIEKIRKSRGEAMASRSASYGHTLYQWAVTHDKLEQNPFSGLRFTPNNNVRDRFLDDDELGKVYKAAEAFEYPFGPFARLLILTGQRRQEVAGIQWLELSKDYDTWTIPAERSKNRKPHTVHLSKPAQDILKAVKKGPNFNPKSDFVFTTTGKTAISGFSRAKERLDEATGVENWVLHDLRRTIVTGLARMGIDHIVADKLLNHQEGTLSSIARVYQQNEYLPQRKDALDKWAVHVLECASQAELPETGAEKKQKPKEKDKEENQDR